MPHAPQDTVDPFGCQGMLLTHIQVDINQNSKITFRGAALQPPIPQPIGTATGAPSQVQRSALALVKLHIVGICPAL